MFKKIVKTYGKVLRFLNIVFFWWLFIPANIAAIFYSLVGIGAIGDFYLCPNPNSFFVESTGGHHLFPGWGDTIFFNFWVPIFFLGLYFIFVILPANILYLPVYERQLEHRKCFLQNIDLKKYFGEKMFFQILGLGLIFLEILINITALIYFLFYIYSIFCIDA